MNNRENIEEMLTRPNNLDYLLIEHGISLTKRNKCGKIKYVSGSNTTEVFDTIELLHLEEFEQQLSYRDNSSKETMKKFTPMYQDFFVLLECQTYLRQQRNAAMDFDGYATVGAGIYYQRTEYKITEDDEFYYVTSKFDIYTNELVDRTTELMYGGPGPEFWLSATRPRCKDEDEEWTNLRSGLEVTDTTSARSSRTEIKNTLDNRTQLTNWLQNNRVSNIRARATDTDTAQIERTIDGLTTCVAIRKGFSLRGPNERERNAYSKDQWSMSTVETSLMRENRIRYPTGSVRNSGMQFLTQQQGSKIVVTTNSFMKRKNDNMFHGMMAPDGRFSIANIITTKKGDDVGEELLALLKTKITQNNYPTTTKKALMNKNAFLETYTKDVESIDSIIEMPGIVGSDISLWREGDYDGRGAGSYLTDYCQLSDGVYKIHMPHTATLRLGNKVAKLLSGTYRICATDTDTDLIKYMHMVAVNFSDISVEIVKGRLSMDEGSDKTMRTTRSNRKLSIQNTDPEAPDRTTRVRRAARKLFGNKLKDDNETN